MKALDIGIWIDEREAWIVDEANQTGDIRVIPSEVEPFNLHGGSGSSTPYGPQDTVSETGLLRRKKQQLKTFFQKVITEIKPAKNIYITGPADSKLGLKKELEAEKTRSYDSLVVETADNMTPNQFKAKVREFFK